MSLLTQIQTDLNAAFKLKNSNAVDALRFIISQIKYARIEKQTDLTDDEIIKVIQKEVKSREEAIALFKQGQRADLVDLEQDKLKYIKKFLPSQLNEAELTAIVQKVIDQNPNQKTNFGWLMKQVMIAVAGRTDGATVARLLKSALII